MGPSLTFCPLLSASSLSLGQDPWSSLYKLWVSRSLSRFALRDSLDSAAVDVAFSWELVDTKSSNLVSRCSIVYWPYRVTHIEGNISVSGGYAGGTGIAQSSNEYSVTDDAITIAETFNMGLFYVKLHRSLTRPIGFREPVTSVRWVVHTQMRR